MRLKGTLLTLGTRHYCSEIDSLGFCSDRRWNEQGFGDKLSNDNKEVKKE